MSFFFFFFVLSVLFFSRSLFFSFSLSRSRFGEPTLPRRPPSMLKSNAHTAKNEIKKSKNRFVLQPRNEILSELEAAAADAASAATRAKEARAAAAEVAESAQQELQELVRGSSALAAAVARTGA